MPGLIAIGQYGALQPPIPEIYFDLIFLLLGKEQRFYLAKKETPTLVFQ